jgi:hypothetical protein
MLVLTMGLNIVLSLLGLSLTPLQLFHESQHPCYSLYIGTRSIFLLSTTNFGVCFHPQLSKDLSPLIMQLRS